MPGPAVTIVEEGGFPVIPVEDKAPVLTVYVPPTEDDPPRGTPITIVEENGYPFVVEGYEAADPLFVLSSDDDEPLLDDNDEFLEEI